MIHEDGPNAESLTSSADGAVIFGSMAKAEVFRAAKGATAAEVWIKPGTNGLQRILGVFADDRSNTLWVCSSGMGPNSAPTVLKIFDLGESGEPKASYDFPRAALERATTLQSRTETARRVCHRHDTGTALCVCQRAATALEVWVADPKLAGGIDGIALGDDQTVYINTFFTGHLVRIAIGQDGKAGTITELNLSMPVSHGRMGSVPSRRT